ncbi:MAG TPA: hypothetical protein VHZ51_10695 [Ktedonobacteraceae bacterium]|nr:hypothetical protein [Ktedonobacteraceae bacterium]
MKRYSRLYRSALLALALGVVIAALLRQRLLMGLLAQPVHEQQEWSDFRFHVR